MTELIYNLFYAESLGKITLLMFLLLVLWVGLEFFIKMILQKSSMWKIGNRICGVCLICIILSITVSSRNSIVTDLEWEPFYSFKVAKIQPELYRSMLMNVFLFFPLGLTLPYALPEKWNRKVPLSILFAMVLSIGIEFTQYHFHLGRAETDDVICNTLGCAIGTISYLLANRKIKLPFKLRSVR